MARNHPVLLVKTARIDGHKRLPGEVVRVHKRAKKALLTSGRGVDPADVTAISRELGPDSRARARFAETEFALDTPYEKLPGRLGPGAGSKRETKPQKPEEYREPSDAEHADPHRVAEPTEGGKVALEALAGSYNDRKKACAQLGLSASGTDDLLRGRLEQYLQRRATSEEE